MIILDNFKWSNLITSMILTDADNDHWPELSQIFKKFSAKVTNESYNYKIEFKDPRQETLFKLKYSEYL